ncbi:GcrA family cell cycle regulator [Komagataeibacter swingsii]|uniref:GcrA cell cycle regulator n=1 Tax=Komagataeibacter swingsii TaxID=215220 RepID=A0A2V4QUZ3_9PROT|nr:GcrA family cell cycle regulator [Komagataeibacter swingsii]PYD68341.1 GcrA cell cycle regulator [Komagataeibacter swingsii]GBQ57868.1 hypothetical protein AA16373_1113 [Komagataeibacter swingsii DSM 16373]
MAMEWTEETIARLRDLWQQGLSTAEIGRQLSVTKNAVVGKAHRLGLKPRPSPIRRAAKAAPAPTAEATVAPAAESTPVAPKPEVTAAPAATAAPAPQKASAKAQAAPAAAPQPKPAAAAPVAEDAAPEPRPARAQPRTTAKSALRPVSEPRRRSSQSCCWPLGDPGTPGFHFCGATPLPGKPYCAEHAQLAYVKLRDRRDNVA